jgi:hypothetical protein
MQDFFQSTAVIDHADAAILAATRISGDASDPRAAAYIP